MFHVSRFRFRERKGFTLVEFLVVIAVTSFLSSYLILYNSTSRRQTALYIEESKIAQIVLRAKSLTISSYGSPTVPCGYGLHIDYGSRTYSLFRYSPGDCTVIPLINPASPAYAAVQTFTLAPGVVFQNCPAGAPEPNKLTDVLFLPPDPKTMVWAGGGPMAGGSGNIYLAASDCSANITVTVSTAGQVSF